jgi:hypothetical protein
MVNQYDYSIRKYGVVESSWSSEWSYTDVKSLIHFTGMVSRLHLKLKIEYLHCRWQSFSTHEHDRRRPLVIADSDSGSTATATSTSRGRFLSEKAPHIIINIDRFARER